MSWDVFLIIILIFFVLTANVLAVTLRNPPEKNIEQWARHEKLQILSIEVTERQKTSFSFLRTNFSYMFYQVRVRTAEGKEKNRLSVRRRTTESAVRRKSADALGR